MRPYLSVLQLKCACFDCTGIFRALRNIHGRDFYKNNYHHKMLKVHLCRFENLTVTSSSQENNMLKSLLKTPFTF